MSTQRHFLIKFLAVFAVVVQALGPAATVQNSHNGVLEFVCVTPGAQPSTLGKALGDLLADKAPTPDAGEPHCGLCTLVAIAPLPVVQDARPAFVAPAGAFRLYEPGFAEAPRGPPVGATGPPSFT